MVQIDYSRDALLPEVAKVTIRETYALPGETSPQDVFARASKAFADDAEHAQRLYDYASKLWFGYSSPILSNGGTDRGLPISCFLNWTGDSREELSSHYDECIWLSTMGGGIGGCWDSVRSVGTKTSKGSESTGIIPFMHVVDALMLGFRQGKTRRGKYSFNLDISHPEIEEFIDITNKKGGDVHRRAIHSFSCVSITDDFMYAVAAKADWPLIDPHTKEVKKVVKAEELWIKLLTSRMQEGVPYIHYIDTSNRFLPASQIAKSLRINNTNLCSEITLPTGPDRTAVCCLSSVNLETFNQWKNHPTFIEDLIRMLDNVLTFFIKNAPEQMWRAINSASQERALGLGAMGWHSYLQSQSTPFESPMALSATNYIFNHIKEKTEDATIKLAQERGPCPDSEGMDIRPRNMQLTAIAPNATSSIICGNVSPSIEPFYSNYYTQKTQNGMFVRKNPYLEDLLSGLGKNTDEVWQKIKEDGGSVQRLDFLTDYQKKVFKTAFEIDQFWIIEQASHRQKYLTQSQSINLFLKPDETKDYIHAVHYYAWLSGVKTLYYVRSKAPKKAEHLGTAVARQVRLEYSNALQVGEVGYKAEHEDSSCLMCEG